MVKNECDVSIYNFDWRFLWNEILQCKNGKLFEKFQNYNVMKNRHIVLLRWFGRWHCYSELIDDSCNELVNHINVD